VAPTMAMFGAFMVAGKYTQAARHSSGAIMN
jgi:hypothetical protein